MKIGQEAHKSTLSRPGLFAHYPLHKSWRVANYCCKASSREKKWPSSRHVVLFGACFLDSIVFSKSGQPFFPNRFATHVFLNWHSSEIPKLHFQKSYAVQGVENQPQQKVRICLEKEGGGEGNASTVMNRMAQDPLNWLSIHAKTC